MTMPPVVEAFILLARDYYRASRHYDNMAATGSRAKIDEALSEKKEIEDRVADHLMLVKTLPGMEARR